MCRSNNSAVSGVLSASRPQRPETTDTVDTPNVFSETWFSRPGEWRRGTRSTQKFLVDRRRNRPSTPHASAERYEAEVTLLYRRTRAGMPAMGPEIEGALEGDQLVDSWPRGSDPAEGRNSVAGSVRIKLARDASGDRDQCLAWLSWWRLGGCSGIHRRRVDRVVGLHRPGLDHGVDQELQAQRSARIGIMSSSAF